MTFEVKHTQKNCTSVFAVYTSRLIPTLDLLAPPTTHAELALIERRALLT